jgi:hypothetical protein
MSNYQERNERLQQIFSQFAQKSLKLTDQGTIDKNGSTFVDLASAAAKAGFNVRYVVGSEYYQTMDDDGTRLNVYLDEPEKNHSRILRMDLG